MTVPERQDPLLEELDEARRRIFEKCDRDPEKVFAWFLEYQKQYADHLTRRPKTGDPLLDEVDEARREILAEYGGDPHKALESYLEYQKQFADRLVNYEKVRHPGKSAA